MELLCSLYAIGELTSSEKKELDEHLAACEQCRSAFHDFEQISLSDLPVIAARQARPKALEEQHLQHPEQMLASILRHDKLSENQKHASSRFTSALKELNRRASFTPASLFRPAAGWAIACAVIAIFAYNSVGARHDHLSITAAQTRTLNKVQSELESWKTRAEVSEKKQQQSDEALGHSTTEKSDIADSLQALSVSYSDLQLKEKGLQQQLSDATAKLIAQDGDLQVTRASLNQQQQQVKELTTELQVARNSADLAHERIAHLMTVSEKTSMTAAIVEPHVTDADARQIFGARDLHIVDVYDVDRSGKTRRTYGRVYYVNRQLLLFYAFDLQDWKNKRKAAGFQAWGFREPNSAKLENLGLFYVDDASLNRWALRVSNADVLSRIDTVFVTLEPAEGSASPSGPKLLFASLGGPANHP